MLLEIISRQSYTSIDAKRRYYDKYLVPKSQNYSMPYLCTVNVIDA